MNDNKNNQRRLSRGMSFLYGMRHKNEVKNNDLDVAEDVNESIGESQIMSDNVAQSRRPSDKDANNNVYTDLEEGEFDVVAKKSTNDDEFIEAFDDDDELEDEELEVNQVATEAEDDESTQEEEDEEEGDEDDEEYEEEDDNEDDDGDEDLDNEDDEDFDIEESDLAEDSVKSANNIATEEQEDDDEEIEWEELSEEKNVSNKSSNIEDKDTQEDEELEDEEYDDEDDVSEEVQIQAPAETNQEDEDDSELEDDDEEQDFEDEEDESEDEEDVTDLTQEVSNEDSLLGEVEKKNSVKSLSQRITETQAQSVAVHEFHSSTSKSPEEETVLDDIDGNESSLFSTQEEQGDVQENDVEEGHVEDELYADIQHEAGFALIPINIIHPNPNQPRKEFNENDLSELTHSIINNGVLQPIIVSKFENDGKINFRIVAGERRYRAAILAGLETMPCIVKKDKTESDLFEISIIENLQRSALNPVEEAMAYYSLASKYDYTQEQVAKAIGKTRAHIANMLRLLNLPHTVKTYLKNGDISIGHAKMLVGLANAAMLADIIVKKQLSVRELENLLKQQKKDEFHEEISRAVDSRILKPEVKSGLDSYISKFKKQGVDANFKFNAKSGSYDFTIKTKEVNRLFEVLSMLDPFEG